MSNFLSEFSCWPPVPGTLYSPQHGKHACFLEKRETISQEKEYVLHKMIFFPREPIFLLCLNFVKETSREVGIGTFFCLNLELKIYMYITCNDLKEINEHFLLVHNL